MLNHHVSAHCVHHGELHLANGTASQATVLLHVVCQGPPVAVACTADRTANVTCREEKSPGWFWFRFGKGIRARSGIEITWDVGSIGGETKNNVENGLEERRMLDVKSRDI